MRRTLRLGFAAALLALAVGCQNSTPSPQARAGSHKPPKADGKWGAVPIKRPVPPPP